MSYAEYNARNWADGRTDDEIREEIARVEHKALHHKYDWQEAGCAHFDYVRADTLRAILAERGMATYLTIPEDRLDDVAPEVRRALEVGAYLDDATLKELRRVGQYEANPLEYFRRIGTSGWYLDEDGHSHYVQVVV